MKLFFGVLFCLFAVAIAKPVAKRPLESLENYSGRVQIAGNVVGDVLTLALNVKANITATIEQVILTVITEMADNNGARARNQKQSQIKQFFEMMKLARGFNTEIPLDQNVRVAGLTFDDFLRIDTHIDPKMNIDIKQNITNIIAGMLVDNGANDLNSAQLNVTNLKKLAKKFKKLRKGNN